MVRTDVQFGLWLTGRAEGDDVLPGGLSVSRDLAVEAEGLVPNPHRP